MVENQGSHNREKSAPDLLAKVQNIESIEERLAKSEIDIDNLRIRRTLFFVLGGLAAFSSLLGFIGGMIWKGSLWGVIAGILLPPIIFGLYLFPISQLIARKRRNRDHGHQS